MTVLALPHQGASKSATREHTAQSAYQGFCPCVKSLRRKSLTQFCPLEEPKQWTHEEFGLLIFMVAAPLP